MHAADQKISLDLDDGVPVNYGKFGDLESDVKAICGSKGRRLTTNHTNRHEKEPAMSTTITVEEAQSKLKELIHQLAPGEEVVITANQQPVAKLVSEPAKRPSKQRPGPGLCKGMITILSDDDEHLKDFEEYM